MKLSKLILLFFSKSKLTEVPPDGDQDVRGEHDKVVAVDDNRPPFTLKWCTYSIFSCEGGSDMGKSRVHYIPLILSIYFPIAFGICYLIALAKGHINPAYSFISDTGTMPPEQYIFAQLVNVGAALWAYFIYIRYVQVEQYMKVRYSQSTPIGNTIALAFGFISSLGMSLVGNFPELKVKEVHVFGAFLAFVGGSIYIVYQGYFTIKLLPHFQSKAIAYIRTFMGVLGLMLYFGAQTTIILAFQRVTNKGKLENPTDAKWNEEDGGYEFQAASVIMEWLLVVLFDIFIVTFVPEFKKLRLEAPSVKFLVDVNDSETSSTVNDRRRANVDMDDSYDYEDYPSQEQDQNQDEIQESDIQVSNSRDIQVSNSREIQVSSSRRA